MSPVPDISLLPLSPLQLRARALGLSSAEDLANEAIARGCFHYLQGRDPPMQRVSETDLSHAELAVLLLATSCDPWLVRIGGMLLGAEGNDPVVISELAKLERSSDTVRAVALAAQRYEPEVAFWQTLLNHLPQGESPEPQGFPHHSRFVSIPGLIGPRTQGKAVWLRPLKPRSLGYAV